MSISMAPIRISRLVTSAVALTLIVWGLTAPPASAAVTRTTTGSCVDGGGLTWHTKVIWGATYRTSTGALKRSVDYAGWTSTLGRVPTDSIVRTYDGRGRLVRSLTRTATVDYRLGSVYAARNPVNPVSGGAKIVITLGRDADGFGNCSVTHSESATADPVIAAVGDMVCASKGATTPTTCQHAAVADSILASAPNAFFTLGDNQYQAGALAEFQKAYHPTFGRLKAITRPTIGNHEYETPNAAGYFTYFGTAAGHPTRGYYSHDVGAWHIITLNSERDFAADGQQLAWLKADLAAHPNRCTLAITHKPRFSSRNHPYYPQFQPLFDTLRAAKAELLLSGHDHHYERFAPQTGSGAASADGLTQIVVGTGGHSLYRATTLVPNSLVHSGDGFGWLRLTLHPGAADLEYVPVAGNTFSERHTIVCR